jgi:hypothetical protein
MTRVLRPLPGSFLQFLWPLPGALTGAAVAFHLYFRQSGLNTDTAAPLVFASAWAFGGMLAGALCTSIAGWLIERGLRRWFPVRPMITSGLALVCLVGLCLGLYAPLEGRLPALFWPSHQEASSRIVSPPERSPCTQAPPTDPKARRAWELECG